MQNQSSLGDNTSSIQVPSGLSTTAGQFTALFTLVALILSAVGYHYSASQIEGWAQAANNLATTVGPLLVLVPVLIGYINSRGKIQSNAINAQAHIATGVPTGVVSVEGTALAPLLSATGGMKTAGTVLEAVPGIIGAAGAISSPGGFKDPATYGQILDVAKDLGVPGAAQADVINQQLHPAQLIAGIISMFHHKSKAPTPPTNKGL